MNIHIPTSAPDQDAGAADSDSENESTAAAAGDTPPKVLHRFMLVPLGQMVQPISLPVAEDIVIGRRTAEALHDPHVSRQQAIFSFQMDSKRVGMVTMRAAGKNAIRLLSYSRSQQARVMKQKYCRVIPGDVVELLYDHHARFAFELVETSLDGMPQLRQADLVASVSHFRRPQPTSGYAGAGGHPGRPTVQVDFGSGQEAVGSGQEAGPLATPHLLTKRLPPLQPPVHAREPAGAYGKRSGIGALPWGVIGQVLSFLPFHEAIRCSRVCTTWDTELSTSSALQTLRLAEYLHGTVEPPPMLFDAIARRARAGVSGISLAHCRWATAGHVLALLGVPLGLAPHPIFCGPEEATSQPTSGSAGGAGGEGGDLSDDSEDADAKTFPVVDEAAEEPAPDARPRTAATTPSNDTAAAVADQGDDDEEMDAPAAAIPTFNAASPGAKLATNYSSWRKRSIALHGVEVEELPPSGTSGALRARLPAEAASPAPGMLFSDWAAHGLGRAVAAVAARPEEAKRCPEAVDLAAAPVLPSHTQPPPAAGGAGGGEPGVEGCVDDGQAAASAALAALEGRHLGSGMTKQELTALWQRGSAQLGAWLVQHCSVPISEADAHLNTHVVHTMAPLQPHKDGRCVETLLQAHRAHPGVFEPLDLAAGAKYRVHSMRSDYQNAVRRCRKLAADRSASPSELVEPDEEEEEESFLPGELPEVLEAGHLSPSSIRRFLDGHSLQTAHLRGLVEGVLHPFLGGRGDERALQAHRAIATAELALRDGTAPAQPGTRSLDEWARVAGVSRAALRGLSPAVDLAGPPTPCGGVPLPAPGTADPLPNEAPVHPLDVRDDDDNITGPDATRRRRTLRDDRRLRRFQYSTVHYASLLTNVFGVAYSGHHLHGLAGHGSGAWAAVAGEALAAARLPSVAAGEGKEEEAEAAGGAAPTGGVGEGCSSPELASLRSVVGVAGRAVMSADSGLALMHALGDFRLSKACSAASAAGDPPLSRMLHVLPLPAAAPTRQPPSVPGQEVGAAAGQPWSTAFQLNTRWGAIAPPRGLFDPVPRTFASGVQALDLKGCVSIHAAALELILAYCPQLERLRLTGCSQFRPHDLLRLARVMPAMAHLDLEYMSAAVTDEVVQALARNCPKLRELCVAGCGHVTDDAINHKGLGGHSKELRRLNLRGCRLITDSGTLAMARGCPQLEELCLNGARLISASCVAQVLTVCPHLDKIKAELPIRAEGQAEEDPATATAVRRRHISTLENATKMLCQSLGEDSPAFIGFMAALDRRRASGEGAVPAEEGEEEAAVAVRRAVLTADRRIVEPRMFTP